MEFPVLGKKIARFGLYEADLQQRVLTKGGLRVKLQDQPFLVLTLLLDRPGELVTREEIQQKLWPSDTFVEFDDGLNGAIKKLRVALSDSADNPRFIETVPRRGYRFLAPVNFLAAPTSQVDPPPETRPPAVATEQVIVVSRDRVVVEQTTPQGRWLWTGILAAVVLVSGGGYYARQLSRHSSAEQPGPPVAPQIKLRPSVAVLGFRNLSGRAETAWLSTAMAEMLNTELSAGRKLRLVPGENIARTKRELPLAETDTLAADTLSRLHTNLDADYIILGSYTDLGGPAHGRIRLDLRMQDARSGEILTEEGFTGRESDIFDLISQAGLSLREKLSAGMLSKEQEAAVRATLPENSQAARDYADGLAKLRAYESLAARDLLLEAIHLEPSHALSHSALARAWRALGYDGRGREEAEMAWTLSKNLSREDQLWIEGYFREATTDWPKAIDTYRTLAQFFPDDLEYGLRLAEVQSNASHGKDALATIDALRHLPAPLNDDPRIDFVESYAANQMGEYKQVQTASDNAARKAEKRGARLLLARIKLMQSTAARNLQDPKGARSLDEEAQRIYEAAGDTYGAARARVRIADLLFEQGEFASSNAITEQCLQIFRSLGSQRDVANALDDIGGGLIQMGSLDKARSTYEQALAVQKLIDSKRGQAMELNNLGVIYSQQGNLSAALKSAQETLEAYKAVGDRDGIASALNNIGEAYSLLGDLPSARKFYEQSLTLRTELGSESDVAESKHNIAEILGDQGDVDGAQKDYDDALAVRLRRGENGAAAQTRLAKAELLLETGNPREAEPLVRSALEQFKKEHQLSDEVSAHNVLAETLLDLNRTQEASAEIAQARELSGKNPNRNARLKIETTDAQLLSANGNADEAIQRLRATIAESEKSEYFVLRIEAGLALGVIEARSGKTAAGQSDLARIESDAKAKGFVLLARRAAAARSQIKS